MVERIRSLLARFSEDEATVRQLVATDASFDALCHAYRKVTDLLDGFETQVKQRKEQRAWLEEQIKQLRERQTSLEEELLTRIEGHQPR